VEKVSFIRVFSKEYKDTCEKEMKIARRKFFAGPISFLL